MTTKLDEMTKIYPEKFASEDKIFSHIHRGARIFIGTGCGEPQYLVHALINYVESHPKAFFDAEVFHVGEHSKLVSLDQNRRRGAFSTKSLYRIWIPSLGKLISPHFEMVSFSSQ